MVVIFGGSFNPPTIAHKTIYRHIDKYVCVDTFIYLPVSQKYAKENLIDNKHRLEMLRRMTRDLPKAKVSDMELRDNAYRGTYVSLKRFQNMYPNQDIGFVIGADHLQHLSDWIEAEAMLKEFVFIVLNRNQKDLDEMIQNDAFLTRHKNHIKKIPEFHSDIASSEFRKNQDPSMVSPEVYEYIKDNELYRG